MNFMRTISNRWRDLSIAHRLYVVVGVMAALIAAELVTLRFAMQKLSAVRAFVGGEGLWSKAQKNAIFRLERFARTHDEADYRAFLEHLRIPDGDRQARIELAKPNPDPDVIRDGFLKGHNHPDDIEPMIELLQRFSWVSFLDRAIRIWTEGDRLVAEFRTVGGEFREQILSPKPDRARIRALEERIEYLNRELTRVESEFSDTLGEGSRWLERLVVGTLFFIVLLVEAIGLTITFRTGRRISRGLAEVSAAAEAIGRGERDRRVAVRSRDEIGKLARSVNAMGEMIQASHADLERRVHERTEELERAVRARDDFVSIVSHELNTPLASLKLQLQLRERLVDQAEREGREISFEKVRSILKTDSRQIDRLVRLVKEMLDVSRLNSGRFAMNHERMDLAEIVGEVVQRFAGSLAAAGYAIDVEADEGIVGEWDPFRIEQVFTNLLTNAMKYGEGRPISVRVFRRGERGVISVRDRGMGIAPDDQSRIFQQFERAVTADRISGLGLGLFIVREIIEAHGGTVAVRSEVGDGAEFVVELPLADARSGLRMRSRLAAADPSEGKKS